MNAPRSGCPINLALEALGDRWSLIVIRALMLGVPMRKDATSLDDLKPIVGTLPCKLARERVHLLGLGFNSPRFDDSVAAMRKVGSARRADLAAANKPGEGERASFRLPAAMREAVKKDAKRLSIEESEWWRRAGGEKLGVTFRRG
ncbi:winged helix-turn-helix transcriptional regulator [Stigmatella aurantiaca]|uniref:Transcriptional regulator n=1 Tax=Stigmatella aurantiaca (strain DW4/3-1) TaxID=378806 RepID=Q08RC4_STIAD|nr:hypothetical protein [Stigmatella aurantiaca]ADO68063.1 transcriptional regulator [Stigmatella aurantiaca DW4/3-1]EAU63030.1 protein of unknown function DUF24 [Stigmatella aurantiaca DW4/3-1]